MNMHMMMVANLVGFVLGTKGMKFMVEQLFGTSEGACCSLGCTVILTRYLSNRDKIHGRCMCVHVHRRPGDV